MPKPNPKKREYRALYKYQGKYINIVEVARLANLSVYYTRSLIHRGISAANVIRRNYPLKSSETGEIKKFGYPSVSALADALGVTRQWIYTKYKDGYRLKKVNGEIMWYDSIPSRKKKNRGTQGRSVSKGSVRK